MSKGKVKNYTVNSLSRERGLNPENYFPYFTSFDGRPLAPGEILVPAVLDHSVDPTLDRSVFSPKVRESMISLWVKGKRYHVIFVPTPEEKKEELWSFFWHSVNLRRQGTHQMDGKDVVYESLEGSQSPEKDDSCPPLLDRLPCNSSTEEVALTHIALEQYLNRLEWACPQKYQLLAALISHPEWRSKQLFQHLELQKSRGYDLRKSAIKRACKYLEI